MTLARLRTRAVPRAASEARQVTTRAAREAGAGPELEHDVALAVTEAVANVVVHAYCEDEEPGDVEVVVARDDGDLLVEVVDEGRGMRARPDSPGLGVGLLLMRRLAASVEVRPVAGGGSAVRLGFAL